MEAREKRIYKVTIYGAVVNAILIALKFVAGIVGRSSAMTADAVHSLSDFITDVIVLVFVRISGKPKDRGHEYGHGKYETFATMVIGVILIAAGIGLLVNGVELVIRSMKGYELPQPTCLALGVAIIAILAKEIVYRFTVKVGREEGSKAVVANAWHHRSDAISSAGTLVGVAGAMFLGEHWRILDPLAAIVVSAFIIKSGYDIMKPCIDELLEASLPKEEEEDILNAILSVEGVKWVHNLRTRNVGNAIAIDFHAKMDGNMTLRQAHAITKEIEGRIRDKYGKQTLINIHMEPASE